MMLNALLFSAQAIDRLAYLDPGSGSYLLQLLIASALGGVLVLRIYWTKVIGFIRRLLGKEVDEDES